MSVLQLSFAIILFSTNNCKCYVHPDLGLNEKELIGKHGYPLETHTAQTEDGYLLELHRIPYGKNNETAKNRPAVLLVPGLLSSSSTFLYFGPESGMAYFLADNGYDVWMGNNRGTTWSKKHLYLNASTHNSEFWNFNLNHLGASDLPTFIDYVLNVTKQQKLFYIGYSQGTTIYFIMMSEKPEYNEKITLMVSISTSLDFRKAEHILVSLKRYFKDLEYLSNKRKYYGILPRNRQIAKIVQGLCNVDSPMHTVCLDVCYILGFTSKQLNKTIIPLFVSNSPNGASFQQFKHTSQLLKGYFRKFDFGPEDNFQTYGQFVPPEYNLSQTKAPIAIYHGKEDNIALEQNLNRLDGLLQNIVAKKVLPGFGHLDVMWGIDAPKIIHPDILELMRSFH